MAVTGEISGDFTDKVKVQYDYGILSYGFLYGSGALTQQAATEAQKQRRQIDCVLAVSDPEEWHNRNMTFHRKDYSVLMRLLGSKTAAAVQEWGAGVYYHPYIPLEGKEIKYGVISEQRLIQDLNTWSDLYIAGRMQKPTVPIMDMPEGIRVAQQHNLRAAFAVARLLLEDRFTLQKLFTTISEISYAGDVRNGVGVDTRKAERIVNGQTDQFRELYNPLLQEAQGLSIDTNDICTQDYGVDARTVLLEKIPQSAKLGIQPDMKVEEVTMLLTTNLRNIVRRSSKVMTMKGLLTAGPFRSLRYVREKLQKR